MEGNYLAFYDEKDSVLGTGVSGFSKDSDDPSKYLGKNLLGLTTMEVRESLMALPEYQEELQAIRKTRKRKVDAKDDQYLAMINKFKKD